MKKQFLISFLISFSFAQVSMSQINEIANKELDKIRNELKSDFVETNNQVNQQFETVQISPQVKELNTEQNESKFFGYDFLKKQINFFDNVPTPSNFKLGAGDEIIISLWGETNSRQSYTINKEGLIYFENVGFINLSNKSLSEAEDILIDELASIYSTLKDSNNPTKLMIELGKLKSINVYFSGHVKNPGINLIHPFSDIFTSLVQAGGISEDGSLRSVQLLRNNKLIYTYDFYSFFIDGKMNFSNIKLIDGDVIHVPKAGKRVTVLGEVVRPSIFELLPNDSSENLFKYAAGLNSSASSEIIIEQIIPINQRLSDDNARVSKIVNVNELSSFNLNDGDIISVLKIANVNSTVEVFGRVKSPGTYPSNDLTLKALLDIAGGFNDSNFRNSINENILVLRKDKNQFYSQEFIIEYESSDEFQLLTDDKVFVYNDPNYQNIFTYEMSGEVKNPGIYPLKKGLTIEDAINLAGGVTEFGTLSGISVVIEFSQTGLAGDEVTIRNKVSNLSLDYEIGKNTIINILPIENVINLTGNVFKPGLISIDKPSISFSKAIELAGGFKEKSIKRKSYIIRKNGEIDKAGSFIFRGLKRVYKGDTVFVPLNTKSQDFNITSFTADILSLLTNIAAILVIVDNND
tara:strand:- start:38246 stop:40150 length:1905 start_codon:yes stop_codon:yes gene_type:complete